MHVRHQTGSYAYAFAKYEEKLENNTEKLKIWKSTLNKAAKLSGYHYPSSNFRYVYLANRHTYMHACMHNLLKFYNK